MKNGSLLDTTSTQTKQLVAIVKRSLRSDNWQHHLDRWLSSGKTLRNYCLSHQLNDKQAYYWRRKLKPELTISQQKVVKHRKCVPIVVKAENALCKQKASTSEEYCIIELGDGKRVRIVSASAYGQFLEKLFHHAAIV